jgi:SAM-dependent methyltransferase
MFEAEDSHWWYVGLHKLILTTIQSESKRLGRTLEIFDAGCGTGRLCQLLAEQGHNVSGCDASEEAIQLSRQRGISDVYQADLNALELEPVTFDVITSIDVLYHACIIDDVAIMRRLLNGLKPGGLLIMNLVAHDFLRSAHDIAVHTRERYTKNSLSLRLLKAGFNIEFASYRVSILFPFIALYRLLLRRIRLNETDVDSDVTSTHSFINYLLLTTIKVENFLMQFTPLPIGSSVFVAARRTSGK